MEKREAVIKDVKLLKSAVTKTPFLHLELQMSVFVSIPYETAYGWELLGELEESLGQVLDANNLEDLGDKLKGQELQIMVTYKSERWDGYERILPRVTGFRPKSPRKEVV